MSAIPLVIIIAREFMVSGLRLLAAEEGVVIAAGIWGKLKTAFTMVTIVGVVAYLSLAYDFGLAVPDFVRTWILGGLIWISTILTIISGLVYLKGCWILTGISKGNIAQIDSKRKNKKEPHCFRE